MTGVARTLDAATDVAEFITDLDGGVFDTALSVALSRTAAKVVDHAKKGKVTIVLDMELIPGTHQVRIGHTLKYEHPTGSGKAAEQFEGASVLHVGQYGKLSMAQQSLLERSKQTQIPGA